MTPAQHAARCLEAAALLLDAVHDAAQDVLQTAANVLDPPAPTYRWTVAKALNGCHLVPLDDEMHHEAEGCACGPTTAEHPDDEDVTLYRHHPLTQPDLSIQEDEK